MKRPRVRAVTPLYFLLFLITTALAQDNRFIGTWRGRSVVNGMAVTTETVFLPNGNFSTLSRSNLGYMVRITGTYSFPRPGIVQYVNKDWEPRNLRMPNGESDEYKFTSPTTMMIRTFLPGMPWLTYQKIQ